MSFKIVKSNLSLFAIILVAVSCVWISFNGQLWKSRGVMEYDVACYYGYLTENFNPHSDTLSRDEITFPGLHPDNKYIWVNQNTRVLKTSMGMAYLYLPFYWAGHVIHQLKYGYPGSGYEVEYRFSMLWFGLFCLISGLFLLRYFLRKYFSEFTTAVTLLLVALGTNALYYTVYEGCMTHVPDFFMFLLFIFLTDKWHSSPNIFNSILLGFFAGLIVLIRPINLLLGVFFLLWNVTTVQTLTHNFKYFLSKWNMILLMGIVALLPWIPQIIYWYNHTGHLFYYSYGWERFYFDRPRIYLGLLSWRKGWLIYTPLGWLMLLGFFFLPRYVKGFFWSSLIFTTSFIYIIFSWWCWWYGGSFSSRAMVESYGILAFPLASLIQFVFHDLKNRSVKILFYFLLLAILALSLYQNWQYKRGVIHWSEMSYHAYKWALIKNKKSPDSLLSTPPWDKAANGQYGE